MRLCSHGRLLPDVRSEPKAVVQAEKRYFACPDSHPRASFSNVNTSLPALAYEADPKR